MNLTTILFLVQPILGVVLLVAGTVAAAIGITLLASCGGGS